jgi:hypothetical protein
MFLFVDGFCCYFLVRKVCSSAFFSFSFLHRETGLDGGGGVCSRLEVQATVTVGFSCH